MLQPPNKRDPRYDRDDVRGSSARAVATVPGATAFNGLLPFDELPDEISRMIHCPTCGGGGVQKPLYFSTRDLIEAILETEQRPSVVKANAVVAARQLASDKRLSGAITYNPAAINDAVILGFGTFAMQKGFVPFNPFHDSVRNSQRGDAWDAYAAEARAWLDRDDSQVGGSDDTVEVELPRLAVDVVQLLRENPDLVDIIETAENEREKPRKGVLAQIEETRSANGRVEDEDNGRAED